MAARRSASCTAVTPTVGGLAAARHIALASPLIALLTVLAVGGDDRPSSDCATAKWGAELELMGQQSQTQRPAVTKVKIDASRTRILGLLAEVERFTEFEDAMSTQRASTFADISVLAEILFRCAYGPRSGQPPRWGQSSPKALAGAAASSTTPWPPCSRPIAISHRPKRECLPTDAKWHQVLAACRPEGGRRKSPAALLPVFSQVRTSPGAPVNFIYVQERVDGVQTQLVSMGKRLDLTDAPAG
jgi:hypothetical protein